MSFDKDSKTETATFAAGCFWCTEAVFDRLKGVHKVTSGYTGGRIPFPTYRQVCDGNTGNAEAFFYQNFVYSEGAPVYCENDRTSKSGWCSLSDIAALKEMMIRIGLLKRFTLPQVILRRHEIEMSYKMK